MARVLFVIPALVARLYRKGGVVPNPRTGGAMFGKDLIARPWMSHARCTRAMWPDREGRSVPIRNVAIAELRPTQATIGFREVVAKRRRYCAAMAAGRPVLMQRQGVPIVIGPEGHAHALDRHHGLCALFAETVVTVPVVTIDDLSDLSQEAFWSTLDARGWCHPYDVDGRLLPYEHIPTSMSDLGDDPYRSLASALRRVGGFDKVRVPQSEFAWADFLRRRLDRGARTRLRRRPAGRSSAFGRRGRPRPSGLAQRRLSRKKSNRRRAPVI